MTDGRRTYRLRREIDDDDQAKTFNGVVGKPVVHPTRCYCQPRYRPTNDNTRRRNNNNNNNTIKGTQRVAYIGKIFIRFYGHISARKSIRILYITMLYIVILWTERSWPLLCNRVWITSYYCYRLLNILYPLKIITYKPTLA